MLHRYDEAKAELSKLPPDDVHALMSGSVIASIKGDSKAADQLVGQLRARYGETANYQHAQIYAQRGDRDHAIAALREAVVMRDPGLSAVKVDPFLDPVRRDPRLAGIIRQLDFPS
jgi:hypothetical protein